MSHPNPTLRALTKATEETLATIAMLGLERVASTKPVQLEEELLDLTVVMELQRDGGKSETMLLTLAHGLGLTIVASMLGISASEIDAGTDLPDGVAELCNMIAGLAKADLADTPQAFTLTLPVAWTPDGSKFSREAGGVVLLDACEAAGEPIRVALRTGAGDS